MWISTFRIIALFSAVCFTLAGHPLKAAEPPEEKDGLLVKILEDSYQASCNDVDRLRDYYRPDAQIIHDGRQTTLDETIKEIKESIRPLQDLRCTYQPRVKTSRIGAEIAYLIVRETIRLAARSVEPRDIHQICSYIFVRDGSRWKIVTDHCSTIPGETV
ncbi:MAG: nuclear transport factor 2 family protein [Nitrospirae bacterium]|nr:nuclear transport factor 2 family protein [Nitrospirota bacterium]